MRCPLCNKLISGKYGMHAHLRCGHKLPHEERLQIMKDLFPINQKRARYDELKAKVKAGQHLTREEFGIVLAIDQETNRLNSKACRRR
jgi:hypothetical protein